MLARAPCVAPSANRRGGTAGARGRRPFTFGARRIAKMVSGEAEGGSGAVEGARVMGEVPGMRSESWRGDAVSEGEPGRALLSN